MRGRGLLIALVLSLATNLFLVSAGAAIYWAGRPAALRPLKQATAALPRADRKPFVAMLRANGARVRPDNRRARALREQAWTALAAGSESAEAVKGQLAQARALNQTSRARVENAVVDYGMAMEPAGREALGQALRPGTRPK